MSEDSTAAIAQARDAGFPVHALPESLRVEGGMHSQAKLSLADAEATARHAESCGADSVIVDHYGATRDYLARLRGGFVRDDLVGESHARDDRVLDGLRRDGFVRDGLVGDGAMRIGVIDDMGDRDLRGVDWILNQNLGAEGIDYGEESARVTWLGPRYALLRSGFTAARQRASRAFSRDDHRLLITFGGGESAEFAACAIRAHDGYRCDERSRRPLRIRCVLSGVQSARDRLDAAIDRSPHDVTILSDVRDMAEQMAWADIALTAGGSTCWELCCMGTPMIAVCTAENQARSVDSLVREGAAIAWPLAALMNESCDIAQVVDTWLADPDKRAAMSAVAAGLVDGRGADRVAQLLLAMVRKVSENRR